MTYTVTWKPSVAARLADIWISAPDREAVSEAANALDQLLKRNPHELGESRHSAERILIVEPLAVVFEIHDADCRVDVLAVRHVPTRPSSDG